jgi:hypothetical protein
MKVAHLPVNSRSQTGEPAGVGNALCTPASRLAGLAQARPGRLIGQEKAEGFHYLSYTKPGIRA